MSVTKDDGAVYDAGSNFSKAVKVILQHEGGLADDPADPGGITNYGISFRFIQDEGLDLDGDGDIDADDIRHLTPEKASEIYKAHFWDANGYGRIPNLTLATKIFDVCVNCGPKRAHIIVQKALNALGCTLTTDGVLGKASWKEILAAGPQTLTTGICNEQANFYKALAAQKPSLAKFLPGWLKRAAWPGKLT